MTKQRLFLKTFMQKINVHKHDIRKLPKTIIAWCQKQETHLMFGIVLDKSGKWCNYPIPTAQFSTHSHLCVPASKWWCNKVNTLSSLPPFLLYTGRKTQRKLTVCKQTATKAQIQTPWGQSTPEVENTVDSAPCAKSSHTSSFSVSLWCALVIPNHVLHILPGTTKCCN